MRERGEEGIEERGKEKEREQKERGRERRRERGRKEKERGTERGRGYQKPETGGPRIRNNMFAWRPKGQGMIMESVIQPGGLSQAPRSM